jgi:DNA repair exonuclease SbcCD ATPase subunit
MAKQLKNLKAKLDQLRQGRQDIERLAHVRVRESENALADLLQENTMLREALDKHQSGSADAAGLEKERIDREEIERLKKQLHAAEQEIQYYKEEFERWRRQAASVEDRLVATSSALQERTNAAQKFEERVIALEIELSQLREAQAAVVPAPPQTKDLSRELALAISERDDAVQRVSSLQSEAQELTRALAVQKQESEAALTVTKLEFENVRTQLLSDLEASRQDCMKVKAAADAAAAAAEASLKIAKSERDELESDLKDAKRVAQVTYFLQTRAFQLICLVSDHSRAPNRHHCPARTRARRFQAQAR